MNRTKAAIVDAFWEILEEKPYSKITVKDIVERCQVNRNTFYYHFHDIPELLEQVLKKDADEIIQNYGHFGSTVDCLEALIKSLLKRKKAFLHIYQSMDRELFLKELDRMAFYCIEEYINTLTVDLAIIPKDKELLIRFYKCALVGIVLDWLDQNMSYDLVESFRRISMLFEGAAEQACLRSTKMANK